MWKVVNTKHHNFVPAACPRETESDVASDVACQLWQIVGVIKWIWPICSRVEPKTVPVGWRCSYSAKKILLGPIVAFLDEIWLGWAHFGWVKSNRCAHCCGHLCHVELKKLTFGPFKSGRSPLKGNIKLTSHVSVLMDFILIVIIFRIIPILLEK
jgi:hypothetical protein